MPTEPSPTPEQMQEVMRSIQGRMRNIAFRHFDHIGARTYRILQNLDLVADPSESLGVDVDLEVLKDPEHPRREDLGSGPLILHRTEDELPQRTILELPMLLYSDSREIREATLQEWDRYFEEPVLRVTRKTLSVVKKYRDDLISEESSKWRMASVAISDALNDDVLISLAGTRQSLECDPVIKESLNTYAPKILYPTVSSLDSIDPAAGHGERDREVLDPLLAKTVGRSDSIDSLCENYLQALGFLPLAPSYSLAAALSQWIEGGKYVNIWEEIWDWSDQAHTPLAVYHACTVFVVNPDLIPEDKLDELWKRILFVVDQKQTEDEESPAVAPWTLRRDLAKHYTYHLEARLPDNDGSQISAFAWWFAEQVAGLFPDDPESAHYYYENWVKSALDRSCHVWLTASSFVLPSFLRGITYTSSSPWATALLTLMGGKLESLAPEKLPEAQRSRFQGALVSSMLSSLPLSLETPDAPIFAQECSMESIVFKWAKVTDEENKESLEQIIKVSRDLGTSEGLCKALRELGESSMVDQAAIRMAFKGKVLADPSIGKDVWEIVSDREWRKDVLANLDQQVQGLLIESLSMLTVQNSEQWFAEMPHFLAELCENTEDKDSRQILFHYVLHLCMVTDTVSALRRLLHGKQKAEFVELVEEYRDIAESMRKNYPPWVQAKLRALMANLHFI